MIINHPSDGLCPQLIVLARVIAHLKEVTRDDLIILCNTGQVEREGLSGALNRWTSLGLFSEDAGIIRIGESFKTKRGQSLDEWTDQLPLMCRGLALKPENCQPLFGDKPGISADFVRGISWLLAQDIFSFPTAWTSKDHDDVEHMESAQMTGEKIVQNDVRWGGLRFWARYLGFATGEGRKFFIDPTAAIRNVLPQIFGKSTSMPAEGFLAELADRLPVLDGGAYRLEVENNLEKNEWRAPSARHLSISLSFALRRLKLDQQIELESKADAAGASILTGRQYSSLESFTHVRLVGRVA